MEGRQGPRAGGGVMPDPDFIQQVIGALWVIKWLMILIGSTLAVRGLVWLVRG
jgi:hypothetical protein